MRPLAKIHRRRLVSPETGCDRRNDQQGDHKYQPDYPQPRYRHCHDEKHQKQVGPANINPRSAGKDFVKTDQRQRTAKVKHQKRNNQRQYSQCNGFIAQHSGR